jgi:hypothetical protein
VRLILADRIGGLRHDTGTESAGGYRKLMTSDIAPDVSAQIAPLEKYRPAGLTPRERHDTRYAELLENTRRVVEVGIPIRDGVVLAADVYLRDDSPLLAPAIVCVNTGYDKSRELRLVSLITGSPEPNHSGFGFPYRESVLYRDSGFVYMINDERGRGKSGGDSSDHVGTLGDVQTGQPVFANATVLVGGGDWKYFVEDDEAPIPLAGYIRRALAELDRRGLVQLMDGDRDVILGLRRLATPGHTPGHAVYVVEDDGQRLYLVGDSMHAPQQLAHPDWAVPFDVNPGQAREVRDWLAAEAARPGTIGVLGCHFPGLLPVSI